MVSQNELMMQTMDLIVGATTCRGGAKVNGGVGGREPHDFPGSLWEAHPLQEETVQMEGVNKVPGILPDEGF